MKKSMRRFGTMALRTTAFVFVLYVATAALVMILFFLLSRLGVLDTGRRANLTLVALVAAAASVLIGTTLAALFARRPLRPFEELETAMHRLAGGDFAARVHLGDGDLRTLSESFNRMAEELGSIEMLREDFTNSFSHEFKTPIVSIRGFARLLQKGGLTAETRAEYIGIILSESERLAEMASKVLMLSHLEHQRIVSERADFDLAEQIRRAVLLLEPKWAPKGLSMDVRLDEALFCGPEELLREVWINLLDNAVKFTPGGGSVAVTLRADAAGATVTVRDDGPGMDENALRHVFDKFYQGDPAHAAEGNGLGLPLAKRIVTLCGGDIQAESRPGEGSAFTVRLPNLHGMFTAAPRSLP